jgi:hypothetical protein
MDAPRGRGRQEQGAAAREEGGGGGGERRGAGGRPLALGSGRPQRPFAAGFPAPDSGANPRDRFPAARDRGAIVRDRFPRLPRRGSRRPHSQAPASLSWAPASLSRRRTPLSRAPPSLSRRRTPLSRRRHPLLQSGSRVAALASRETSREASCAVAAAAVAIHICTRSAWTASSRRPVTIACASTPRRRRLRPTLARLRSGYVTGRFRGCAFIVTSTSTRPRTAATRPPARRARGVQATSS